MGIYHYQKEEYEQAKKYFLMALGYNNTYAMWWLGKYYHRIKLYKEVFRYLLMGIKNKNCVKYLNKVLPEIKENKPYAWSMYAHCAHYLDKNNHKYYKKLIQQHTFSQINKLTTDEIKYRAGNMGMWASECSMLLKKHNNDLNIVYSKINPKLIYHLGIKNKDDMVKKVKAYLK